MLTEEGELKFYYGDVWLNSRTVISEEIHDSFRDEVHKKKKYKY